MSRKSGQSFPLRTLARAPIVMGGNLNPFKAVEKNPADVEGKAQVKAGKGLYNKLDGVPDGTVVMVLEDDGEDYLADDPFLLEVKWGLYILHPEETGPRVLEYPEPMYMDGMPMPIMGEIWADIPLKSAAFW
jgi:hypothetical protein